MKKKRNLVIVAVLVFAFGSGAIAKEAFDVIKAQIRTDFVIEIDGVKRDFKNVDGERVYPLLHDGTTYLPLRAIGEIMGKKVYWYEEDKRIEIKDDNKKLPTVTDADVIIEDNTKVKENEKPKKPDIDETDFIGKDKAKEIALKKANVKEADVNFIKVELERDNGIYVYEIEFKHGYKEYTADIKAVDGNILDWEVEKYD